MLCGQGCGVQPAEHTNERNEVYLRCGHLRTPALLDPTPGHISLEHILASPSDKLVRRLFPITDANGWKPRGRDLADVIGDMSMQAQREAWAA
jgi:hypothetical protein